MGRWGGFSSLPVWLLTYDEVLFSCLNCHLKTLEEIVKTFLFGKIKSFGVAQKSLVTINRGQRPWFGETGNSGICSREKDQRCEILVFPSLTFQCDSLQRSSDNWKTIAVGDFVSYFSWAVFV